MLQKINIDSKLQKIIPKFLMEKIYNINEDEQEITITKPTNQSLFLSPISYLEFYKKNHSISYVKKSETKTS